MLLPVICQSCQASFRLGESLQGQKVFCPKCGQPIISPAAPEPKLQTQVVPTSLPRRRGRGRKKSIISRLAPLLFLVGYGGIVVLLAGWIGGNLAFTGLRPRPVEKLPVVVQQTESLPAPFEAPRGEPVIKVEPGLDEGKSYPGQLDRQTLLRIKEATVYVRVTLPDGSIFFGTGFFGHGPGLVLTNAHVLGMLGAEGRRPQRIEIVYRNGEPGERTYLGKILGLDPVCDLAVLRVEGENLPAPLPVKSARDLLETQQVFVVGFPFGEELGKNVTVSTSTVSSLRKDSLGQLQKVQINGGMHPGNSGGPLVNAQGEVVGVAVAGITATQINFAIPGDFVHAILNGRLVEMHLGQPFREARELKVPVKMDLLDPLEKIRKVSLDVWTGAPGPARDPAKARPPVLVGDSPHLTVDLRNKEGSAQGEVALPPLGAGKVYWVQPSYVNGAGEFHWVLAHPYNPGPPVDRQPAEMMLRHQVGTRHLDLHSKSTLKLLLGGKEKSMTLNMQTDLLERTVSVDAQQQAAMVLEYKSYALGISVDNKPAPQDPDLDKALKNLPLLTAQLVVDNKGGLVVNKADLGKVPAFAREDLADLHSQIQDSLEAGAVPIPNKKVQVGEQWQAVRRLPILTDQGVEQALLMLTYTYEGHMQQGKQRIALLTIAGTATGTAGQELRVGGKASGLATFDLDLGQTASVHMTVQLDLDLFLEGQRARAHGILETQLVRLPKNP
jgi:hypothetical protein